MSTSPVPPGHPAPGVAAHDLPALAPRRHLRAIEIGSLAREALACSAAGRVVARFERTVYLLLDGGGCVWVGGSALAPGPLALRCGPASTLPTATVRRGDPVRLEACRLRIGALGIDMSGTPVWVPPVAVLVPGVRLRGVARRLAARALALAPPESLLAAVTSAAASGAGHRVAAVAAEPLGALRAWLSGATVDPAPTVAAALLGLGPGLTPSGDDLLCGVLVCLHAIGAAAAARGLAGVLEPRLASATGAISAAHLRAAARGQGAEPLHRCLQALATGDPDSCLGPLQAHGHASGWDALAGVLLVVESLRARPGRPRRPPRPHSTVRP